MDEKVLAAAKQLLFNAVNHDRAGRTVEACRAYTDGIEMLLQLMSVLPNGSDKSALRSSIENYMSRAESLRNASGRSVKVEFFQQRKIDENSTGHSYESIFAKCLDERLTEVIVEDPYIIAHYQIMNFVMFCEMLVEKCANLRRIRLFTGEKTIMESLNELKECLRSRHGVTLDVEVREFHDREIRFNNGWLVKIGRGLDIYKPVGKYTIGSHSYKFRPCKKTIVDIFKLP